MFPVLHEEDICLISNNNFNGWKEIIFMGLLSVNRYAWYINKQIYFCCGTSWNLLYNLNRVEYNFFWNHMLDFKILQVTEICLSQSLGTEWELLWWTKIVQNWKSSTEILLSLKSLKKKTFLTNGNKISLIFSLCGKSNQTWSYLWDLANCTGTKDVCFW